MKQFVADRLNKPTNGQLFKALTEAVASLDHTINLFYDLTGYQSLVLDLTDRRDKLQTKLDQLIDKAISKAQGTDYRDKLAQWFDDKE